MPGMFDADPIFSTFDSRSVSGRSRSTDRPGGVFAELLGSATPRSFTRPGTVGGVAATPDAGGSTGLIIAGALGVAVAGGLVAYLASQPKKSKRRVR